MLGDKCAEVVRLVLAAHLRKADMLQFSVKDAKSDVLNFLNRSNSSLLLKQHFCICIP